MAGKVIFGIGPDDICRLDVEVGGLRDRGLAIADLVVKLHDTGILRIGRVKVAFVGLFKRAARDGQALDDQRITVGVRGVVKEAGKRNQQRSRAEKVRQIDRPLPHRCAVCRQFLDRGLFFLGQRRLVSQFVGRRILFGRRRGGRGGKDRLAKADIRKVGVIPAARNDG